MKIFSGSAHPEFSKCLLKHFSKGEIGDISIKRFADGEINIVINESVRKETCFVVQPTGPSENYSPNDNLMELLITIDALKRGSAKRVIAVIPYYGYERQDRKDYSRAPISAKVIASC
ncbi:MAG: ribose-phosphate pyrophosphokinase-like domain-containing protein, partial [Bdellovibrionales bacterium]|nr:ribose-phosphate pyrophosphokinase-like domain-containing protein [Bdellovibrionales bacterium]